jgi:hypothetical protein
MGMSQGNQHTAISNKQKCHFFLQKQNRKAEQVLNGERV